jgi:tetratricopeptide (TPR) repeat protein
VSTEQTLFAQLKKLCTDALNLDAESEPLKALQDRESAAPIFTELQERLLPEAKRIAEGPGKNLALAHFTHGLVLRILQRQHEAETAFRQANDIQPGVLETLRELVRCLGEQGKHSEALPFARVAVSANPDDAGAWGNLAMCLIQCRERVEARKAINRAIELDPLDPLNRYIRDNFDGYFK